MPNYICSDCGEEGENEQDFVISDMDTFCLACAEERTNAAEAGQDETAGELEIMHPEEPSSDATPPTAAQ